MRNTIISIRIVDRNKNEILIPAENIMSLSWCLIHTMKNKVLLKKVSSFKLEIKFSSDIQFSDSNIQSMSDLLEPLSAYPDLREAYLYQNNGRYIRLVLPWEKPNMAKNEWQKTSLSAEGNLHITVVSNENVSIGEKQ